MRGLRLLDCRDSPQMAAARRRDLEVPRDRAEALGLSAVEAARAGRYRAEDGREIDWSAAVEGAVAAKVSIPPDAALPDPPPRTSAEMRVLVSNETTLGASRRLVDAGLRPLALSFANGVEPGGGFLIGARAQEEVLCRSSALYLTLVGDPMYAFHRESSAPDQASDWVILSPDVPVFREDDGTALYEPWRLSVLTCAAPFVPSVGQPRSGDLLAVRIRRVLAVARGCGFETLVLGAWGCGAFRNDPVRTARDFRTALEGEFAGAFGQVVFAITDWSPERRFLGPFRDELHS